MGRFFVGYSPVPPPGLSTLGVLESTQNVSASGHGVHYELEGVPTRPRMPFGGVWSIEIQWGAPGLYQGGLSTPGVLESTQIYEWSPTSPTTTPHPNRNLLPPSPR